MSKKEVLSSLVELKILLGWLKSPVKLNHSFRMKLSRVNQVFKIKNNKFFLEHNSTGQKYFTDYLDLLYYLEYNLIFYEKNSNQI